MKTFNAIDKDALLRRLRTEKRRYMSQDYRRNGQPEIVARYDFAICAVESEPSVEAAKMPPPEKTI